MSKRKPTKRPVSKRPEVKIAETETVSPSAFAELQQQLREFGGMLSALVSPKLVDETELEDDEDSDEGEDAVVVQARHAVATAKPVQAKQSPSVPVQSDSMAHVRAKGAEHNAAVVRLRNLGVLPENGMVNAWLREIIEACMRDAKRNGSPIMGVDRILKAAFKLGTDQQRLAVIERTLSTLLPALISEVTVAKRGVSRLKTKTTRLSRKNATPIAAKAPKSPKVTEDVEYDAEDTDWLND